MSDLVTRYRAARGDRELAVLEGFHAVKHAIRFGADIEAIAVGDVPLVESLAARLAPDVAREIRARMVEVPAEVFDRLSPVPPDTRVIGIARRRITTLAEVAGRVPIAPIVVLDAPSHSGNIGAAIRVAAAAGADAVITTGTTDPWNAGAIRGSAGLHYALPVVWSEAVELPGRRLVAVDPGGDPLMAGFVTAGMALVFGSERHGVSAAMIARAEARVRIPMRRGVSSLNLATAVAVMLYSRKSGE